MSHGDEEQRSSGADPELTSTRSSSTDSPSGRTPRPASPAEDWASSGRGWTPPTGAGRRLAHTKDNSRRITTAVFQRCRRVVQENERCQLRFITGSARWLPAGALRQHPQKVARAAATPAGRSALAVKSTLPLQTGSSFTVRSFIGVESTPVRSRAVGCGADADKRHWAPAGGGSAGRGQGSDARSLAAPADWLDVDNRSRVRAAQREETVAAASGRRRKQRHRPQMAGIRAASRRVLLHGCGRRSTPPPRRDGRADGLIGRRAAFDRQGTPAAASGTAPRVAYETRFALPTAKYKGAHLARPLRWPAAFLRLELPVRRWSTSASFGTPPWRDTGAPRLARIPDLPGGSRPAGDEFVLRFGCGFGGRRRLMHDS